MTATITRWWWVRHAPVTANDGRIYGHDDLPADCSDGAVFAALAALLPTDAVWVTSHLGRTRQTAAAIGAAQDAGRPRALPPALVEPDLAEQHFGDWQGLTLAELGARRAGALHRFWLAPAHEAPPGGESFEGVVVRVAAAVERLTAAHRGRDIVAIAHGGSIRAALAVALELPPERALAFAIDNCSLTRLDHIDAPEADAASFRGPRQSWRVAAVNLRPGAPP